MADAKDPGIILLLHNIPPLLSSLTRTSSPVRTNALLSPLLRRLTLLTRNHASLLVLMGLPSPPPSASLLKGAVAGWDLPSASTSRQFASADQDIRSGATAAGGIEKGIGMGLGRDDNTNISAFESNIFGAAGMGLSRSVAGTLDQSLDTVVLVGVIKTAADDTGGAAQQRERLVECVRHRSGGCVGKWASWA